MTALKALQGQTGADQGSSRSLDVCCSRQSSHRVSLFSQVLLPFAVVRPSIARQLPFLPWKKWHGSKHSPENTLGRCDTVKNGLFDYNSCPYIHIPNIFFATALLAIVTRPRQTWLLLCLTLTLSTKGIEITPPDRRLLLIFFISYPHLTPSVSCDGNDGVNSRYTCK